MHSSAHKTGKYFFDFYSNENNKKIVDLGGADINGTLRDTQSWGKREYISVDIDKGKGVDIVVELGKPLPFEDNSIDIVVSTSCFEHDFFFWESFLEMLRIVKDGGYIYINAPSYTSFHRYPYDCWRFFPDAGVALREYARKKGCKVDLMESFVSYSGEISDFVAIFRKGNATNERKDKVYSHVSNAANIHDIEFKDDSYLQNERGNEMDIINDSAGDKLRKYRRRYQLLICVLAVVVVSSLICFFVK